MAELEVVVVAVVVVVHVGALERLITRIVVVDAGRIRFDGTPRQYAAARETVHHDHDSHHHDAELDVVVDGSHSVATSLPQGPLDPRRSEGGHR